jgi:hypothetical protein
LIDFLKASLKPHFRVFEYGSGFSTLFYAPLVSEVYSLETRKEWYDLIISKNIPNIHIKLSHPSSFVQDIEIFGQLKYDLIIIDSIRRIECLQIASNFISDNGLIVLDNSERENLQNADNIAKSCNLGLLYTFIDTGPNREGQSEAKVYSLTNAKF